MSVRRIGFWSAVALVMANMIGTGVFTTSGYAVAAVGDARMVLLAWALGGLIAWLGTVCYAALGVLNPVSGGEYQVIRQRLHPALGFLAGWISLFAGFSAPIAASALALQAYLDRPQEHWIGALAIVVSGFVHSLSVRQGLFLQNLAVGLKLLALLVFVLWIPALGLWPEVRPTPGTFHGWSPFFINLIWISFAFSGWNALLYIAG